MAQRTVKGLKSFITRCINQEPDGNFCYYNMWPRLNIKDEEVLADLQKYVNKKHIKYLFIVDNVEEARPQRTGEEPEFYRPITYMRVFSKNPYQSNTFVIAFWGTSWGDEWQLDKILEGLKDFPEYSTIIRLEEEKDGRN